MSATKLDDIAATIAEARALERIPQATEAYGIRPYSDHVLVRQPKRGARMRENSLLWMPGEGELGNQAEVLAIGPGREREDGTYRPINVRVGDRVILAVATYNSIAVDAQTTDESGGVMNESIDLLLVKEGLIIGVVAKETVLLSAGKQPKNYAEEWGANAE
jgi:chaperonin GroES